MDFPILMVIFAAVGVSVIGARMMYCGHHHKTNRRAGRSGRPDRRRYPRGTDRRAPP